MTTVGGEYLFLDEEHCNKLVYHNIMKHEIKTSLNVYPK